MSPTTGMARVAQAVQPNQSSVTAPSPPRPKKESKPTHVHIEFSDSGSGMNPELRKQAFTSLLNSSKPGGTGIGLAIVNRIIESHGGEIKIRPNIKGTTFSVYLPTFPN